MGKRMIEVDDDALVLTFSPNPQKDNLGKVATYMPIVRLSVGDKAIGLVTDLNVKTASSGVTPEIKVTLAGGLAREDAKSMPDALKEAIRDYARLLSTIPGVTVESPFE